MGGPGGLKKDVQGNEKAIVTFVVYGGMSGPRRDEFNKALQKVLDGFKGQITAARIDPKAPGDP
jgi:hypothetical protein